LLRFRLRFTSTRQVGATSPHQPDANKTVFPFADSSKGTVKLTEKHEVATAIFQHGHDEK